MSFFEEDETDYPAYRETIPLRVVVRMVEQELFEGWYELYTSERRERETVAAYQAMPQEFQLGGSLDSLRSHWQAMERYLLDIERAGRRLLMNALETGELPQYVFNLDAPGRRMFQLPPSREIRFYAPHGVGDQKVRLWEVHLWKDQFDDWFKETAKRERGGEQSDSIESQIASQKRHSPKRQATIDCLRELFPDTNGDPGDNFIVADIARALKPLADARNPEWATSVTNTYEARVNSAIPSIRAERWASSQSRANVRQR